MTQNDMKVYLHRLHRDGKDAAAERIRYAGMLAFRYWLNVRPGKVGSPQAAALVSCELQAIVETHDYRTTAKDWPTTHWK